jgi:hypothetical protein
LSRDFGHSWVRLDLLNSSLVVGPGNWTEREAVLAADPILLTHEHVFHVDVPGIAALRVAVYAPRVPTSVTSRGFVDDMAWVDGIGDQRAVVPDLVLIMLGINDANSEAIAPKRFKEDLGRSSDPIRARFVFARAPRIGLVAPYRAGSHTALPGLRSWGARRARCTSPGDGSHQPRRRLRGNSKVRLGADIDINGIHPTAAGTA